MSHSSKRFSAALAAATVLCVGAAQAAAPQPQDTVGAGKIQYRSNCAVCHGPEARGDGPLSTFLTKKPTNLRGLTQAHGGTFPFGQIYDVIDGRGKVGAHGTREMPVWGANWKADAAEGFGETYVRGKILEMIIYLRSIQD
ncbi:MAG: cytochrome c [Gammaproteobacteria bacterium]|nr:cytochrome c [Gammaproteobacteria bacterium]